MTLRDIFHEKQYSGKFKFKKMFSNLLKTLHHFSARNNIKDFVKQGTVQFIGCSGTVTTLSALFQGLYKYDRAKVDGSILTHTNILDLKEQLRTMPYLTKVNHPCIGRGRADLVSHGASLLDKMCRIWKAPSIIIADRGVREGILSILANRPLNVSPNPRLRHQAFKKIVG